MLGKALGGAVALVAVFAALTPALAADPGDPPPGATDPSPSSTPTDPAAPTVISIDGVAIDPKLPGRVKVQLSYTCSAPAGAKSLNTSVEQTDPTDPAEIAFGATRSSPTLVVCDGTTQSIGVVVQSKTSNWIDGVDGVIVATVSDLGATPPAAADAKQLTLTVAKATP